MDGQLVALGAPPAHLMGADQKLNLNAAARANLLASFAVLKIRGKQWRVRYRGDETLITASAGTGHDGRPLPEMPVQYVDVVVVGIASAISKKFYLGGYVDGESKAPDCFSVNGISPDVASAAKQSTMCATCPQNIWGSVTTERGRKAKACRDGRRIAVVPMGDVENGAFGGPMLLDIPPTSLANLEMYTRTLERLQADISQVVTRIGFGPATHQELVFSTTGWVGDPADYAMVIEHARSDTVSRMLEAPVDDVTSEPSAKQLLGQRPAHLAVVPTPLRASPAEELDEPDEKPEDKPVAPPPPPAPTPTPPPAAAQARRTSPFGNRVPAAQTSAPAPALAKTQAPAAPTAPTIVQGAPASLEAEIDNLLSGC